MSTVAKPMPTEVPRSIQHGGSEESSSTSSSVSDSFEDLSCPKVYDGPTQPSPLLPPPKPTVSAGPQPILLKILHDPTAATPINLGIEINLSLPMISYVHPTSPLLHHLHVGDILLELDGLRSTELDYRQLHRWFHGRSPTSSSSRHYRTLLFLPGKKSPYNHEYAALTRRRSVERRSSSSCDSTRREDPPRPKCLENGGSDGTEGCGDRPDESHGSRCTVYLDEEEEEEEVVSGWNREEEGSSINTPLRRIRLVDDDDDGTKKETAEPVSPSTTATTFSKSSEEEEEFFERENDDGEVSGMGHAGSHDLGCLSREGTLRGIMYPSLPLVLIEGTLADDALSSNDGVNEVENKRNCCNVDGGLERQCPAEDVECGQNMMQAVHEETKPGSLASISSDSESDTDMIDHGEIIAEISPTDDPLENSMSDNRGSVQAENLHCHPINDVSDCKHEPTVRHHMPLDDHSERDSENIIPDNVFDSHSERDSKNIIPDNVLGNHSERDSKNTIPDNVLDNHSERDSKNIIPDNVLDNHSERDSKNIIPDNVLLSNPSIQEAPIVDSNIEKTLEKKLTNDGTQQQLHQPTHPNPTSNSGEDEHWEQILQYQQRNRPAPKFHVIHVKLGLVGNCEEDISTIYGGTYNPSLHFTSNARIEDHLIGYMEEGQYHANKLPIYDCNTLSQLTLGMCHAAPSKDQIDRETRARKVQLEEQDYLMKKERLNRLKRRHCVIEGVFALLILVAVGVLIGILLVSLRGNSH